MGTELEEFDIQDADVTSAADIMQLNPKNEGGVEGDDDINYIDGDIGESDDESFAGAPGVGDDEDEESFADDDDDDDGMGAGRGDDKGDKDDEDADSNVDAPSDDSADENDNDEDDGDDDEDDIDDTNKFKKFNQALRANYITETHPESASHNDDEIHSLAHVVRDQTGAIIDPLHRTIPILTKYEKTRILGVRTKQINEGASPYISVKSTIIDGYIIAMRELEEKKIPFIVRRPLPNGGSEYWYLQDLEII